LSEDRVRGYKHFANKLWNITRFVLTANVDATYEQDAALTEADAALVHELSELVASVSDLITRNRIDLASDHLYHFAWHRFADEILEDSKPIISGDDQTAQASRQLTLLKIHTTLIKLLHPFMPFVTEAIWKELPSHVKDRDMLMVSAWPR
jgi:valyl-tRNA synthetase